MKSNLHDLLNYKIRTLGNRFSIYSVDPEYIVDMMETDMPIYTYECSECKERFDKLEKMDYTDSVDCRNCDAKQSSKRIVTAPAGLKVNGKGAYSTKMYVSNRKEDVNDD